MWIELLQEKIYVEQADAAGVFRFIPTGFLPVLAADYHFIIRAVKRRLPYYIGTVRVSERSAANPAGRIRQEYEPGFYLGIFRIR